MDHRGGLDIFHFVIKSTLSRLKSFPFQAVYDLFFLISTNTVYTMAALLTSQQVHRFRQMICWIPENLYINTKMMSLSRMVCKSQYLDLITHYLSIFPSCTLLPPWFRWSTYFWPAGIPSSCFILIHDSVWGLGFHYKVFFQWKSSCFSFIEKIEKANLVF